MGILGSCSETSAFLSNRSQRCWLLRLRYFERTVLGRCAEASWLLSNCSQRCWLLGQGSGGGRLLSQGSKTSWLHVFHIGDSSERFWPPSFVAEGSRLLGD